VRSRSRHFVLLLFLVLALLPGRGSVFAQEDSSEAGDQQFYPETGHWITGDFLRTYQSVTDPVMLYGYPITEAFQDQTTGRVVQYFQRARFELFPENPNELKVRISPLGEYLYSPGKPLPLPENFPACQHFSETGFQVCYTFLDFFKANGGAAQFGYPISNFEVHEGRIVQYFQRARLEWRPELPSGQRVAISDLGKTYFEVLRENPVRLLPAPIQNNRPQAVLSLQARAFPKKAVLPQSGTQTFFVIVQDQNLQPVAEVEVRLRLALPDGEERNLIVPEPTNKDGILQFDYSYRDQIPGIVTVTIEANRNGLAANTTTSFRIWW
jgi:hypothetical protein